ncbi:MAG: Hsp33 family molecular chaperone HslO [Lachnospiraceae bacterium]|nr:Hsp33 family molecular chaperone HslO [Lachnospiraceae bacterium]
MTDYILRATAANAYLRVFAATTRNLVETARQAHNTSPVATAALGRLLTAGAMMGAMMKGENDVLTLKINGDGPIEGIVVTADAQANVKGYVYNPEVLIHANAKGKLDVAGAVGIGVLQVIKDIGMKEPYVGETILISSEIAEDLTYYFATSEQVPSSVALGVLMNRENTVRRAGGFIIQVMPGAPDEVIDRLEEKLRGLAPITSMLDEGKTPEIILEEIFGDMGLVIMDKLPTKFYCNCDKKRVERALVSVGEKELREMIAEGKPVELTCHFCNTSYTFSVEEMEAILRRSGRA